MPESEHLVMTMADACGISTVPHALIRYGETTAYITKRVDRINENGHLVKRLHQYCDEDGIVHTIPLLFFTNLPKSVFSTEEIIELYSKRYDLEVTYKTLKTDYEWERFFSTDCDCELCAIYALRSKYILENPMTSLDRKLLLANCSLAPVHSDEERVLSKEQFSDFLKRLAEHEEKYPGYMPDYAAELACLTGMRVGELAALKWSCIDDVYIHIDFSEHRLDFKDKPSEIIIGEPKNRKHRLIPITKEIRELLTRIKNASPSKDSEFLFVDGNGERYTAAKISGAVRRHFKAIGVEKGSVHRIRRTVSSMLNRILSQKDVSALLGHTETVNDMFYNYSTANMKEKAHALTDLRELLHGNKNTESA